MLSDPSRFESKPYGGVFRLRVPSEAPWAERYTHLKPIWNTHDYTPAGYADYLSELVNSKAPQLGEFLGFWNPDRVRAMLDLVQAGPA
jgi:hypothetical protein